MSVNAYTIHAEVFLRLEIGRSKHQLTDRGELFDSAVKCSKRFASALHGGVDGEALKESKKVHQQNRWIAEGTRFLTGRDFVQICMLRINALSTRS